MKAILVIDMPIYCCVCPFFRFKYRDDYDSKETVCTINGYVNENGIDTIASWCPLKPLPTKKKPLFDPDHCEIEKEIKIVHEIDGYNRCIDEILGETKNETVKSAG